MDSIIKWRTGEPKEKGLYLTTYRTLRENVVEPNIYEEYGWDTYSDEYCKVIAWCPLNEIEPYKE